MAKANNTRDFYVYLHRRATDGKVFYVGKGNGDRAFEKRRNKYWKNTVAKHGYTVEFYATGLQEWYAFELEKELIAYYGRENLCNMTDGGEGSSGRVISHESRKKISKTKTGKKLSNEHIELIRKKSTGRTHTNESKAKISKSNSERKLTKESIDKIKKNMPHKRCVSTYCGMFFDSIGDAICFLRKNGWPKAYDSALIKCCKGTQSKAYGYKWFYAK